MRNRRLSPIWWTLRCSSTCQTPRFRAPRNRWEPRTSPILPSNILGNRVSPWLNRWRQPCAGQRRLRENPNLTPPLRLRRTFRNPERGQPPPQPVPKKFLRPVSKNSVWNRPPARYRFPPLKRSERSRGSKIHPPATGGIRTPLLRHRSSFSSGLDENQASDAGGSKKILLVGVLLVGLAAAGYFGWTKMQSAHPEPPVQQSAVPASSGTAGLPAQPAPSTSESQSTAGEVVTQPDQDLSTTSAVPHRPSLQPPWSRKGRQSRLRFRPRPRQRKMMLRSSMVLRPQPSQSPRPCWW